MTKVRNGIAPWALFLATLLTGAVLAGCRTQPNSDFAEIPGLTPAPIASPAPASVPEPAQPAAAVAAEKSAPGIAASTEVLNPGDTIRIEYNDLPTITPPFQGPIKDDGSITLILNQRFVAAGKTPSQLEKEIRAAYVPKLYNFMTVTVSPVNETRYYYVGGEVRSPGRQMYLSRITVLRAIQSVGGFTDFARKSKVKVTRADGKRIDTVNCVKALENPRLDLDVYPGDTIHVPRRFW